METLFSEYGIKGPEDVAKIGIAEYNRLCRSIVMRHSGAWRDTVSYSIFRPRIIRF